MLNNRALLEDNRRQVEVWIFWLTSMKWETMYFVKNLSENMTKPNVHDIKCVYNIYISECVCCSALSTCGKMFRKTEDALNRYAKIHMLIYIFYKSHCNTSRNCVYGT